MKCKRERWLESLHLDKTSLQGEVTVTPQVQVVKLTACLMGQAGPGPSRGHVQRPVTGLRVKNLPQSICEMGTISQQGYCHDEGGSVPALCPTPDQHTIITR